MLKSGIRTLLNRLARDLDTKAELTFGGLLQAHAADEAARDEFITAYVVSREPATLSRSARLSRLSAGAAAHKV